MQTNSNLDPIVEILRLAYRRGLAIRREQVAEDTSNHQQSRESERSPVEGNDRVPQIAGGEGLASNAQ